VTAVEPELDSRRFGWAALASATTALAAYLVFVLTAAGQRFENRALVGGREEFRQLREESLAELDEIAALSLAIGIALVLGVALLRRKPVLAAASGGIIVAAVVATDVLKRLLVRPELVEAPVHWLSNSFPSGHVAVAVAVGMGAVLVVPYVLRAAVTLGAALYAMAVALAVGIAGWHRLSDVAGAAFTVLALGCVALYLLARGGRIRPLRVPRRIGYTLMILVLGGSALVFAGVGLMGWLELLPDALASDPAPATPAQLRLAFTSMLALCTAAIGLVFLSFLWLVRPFAIDEPAGPPAGR
jgi:hypothetical protein